MKLISFFHKNFMKTYSNSYLRKHSPEVFNEEFNEKNEYFFPLPEIDLGHLSIQVERILH